MPYIYPDEYGKALSGNFRVGSDDAIKKAEARYQTAVERQERNPDFRVDVPIDPTTVMTSKKGYAVGRCQSSVCAPGRGRDARRVGWAWKAGKANLTTMRCPRCGNALDQTTLALDTRFWVVPDEVVERIVAKTKPYAELMNDKSDWTGAKSDRIGKMRESIKKTVEAIRAEVEAPIKAAQEAEDERRLKEAQERTAQRRAKDIEEAAHRLASTIATWELTPAEVDALVAKARKMKGAKARYTY